MVAMVCNLVLKAILTYVSYPSHDMVDRWSGSGPVAPNVNGLYLLYVSSTSTVNQVELRGCFRYVFNEN